MLKMISTIMLALPLTTAQAASLPDTLNLNSGWEFAEKDSSTWRSATVPGCVHQDLLDHQLIPDPFYGENEQRVQWVERKDWVYRTTFQLTPQQLSHDGAVLEFDGLDTYADIYLNGALLAKTDNMFVGYHFNVRKLLQEGTNRLLLVFHSPVTTCEPQADTQGFSYPADNDHAEKKVSVYSRKAPYSFGWDWGIRLATSGIWRPARLVLFNHLRITDSHIQQLEVSSEVAKLKQVVNVASVGGKEMNATVSVDWLFNGKRVKSDEKSIHLNQHSLGSSPAEFQLEIDHPQLWWPNGWGEQNLYDVVTRVRMGDSVLSQKCQRVGLRSLHVVMEPDSVGKCLRIEVNGKPMFAKGADYIPDDALLPRITKQRYRQIIADAKAANMNLLRVWGGGIYEDDAFYDVADEAGILVWQDFMFACTTYPSDRNFLNRVRKEAIYNIKRLRNHASLAMWVGNNEIYEGMRYWGWKEKYSESQWEQMKKGYDKIFRQILPRMVKQYDKGRFYMHSSPLEANWGRPESWTVADSHNWGTWYGQKRFETLDEEIPRFMSEYGFQSFPEMKTIRTFAQPGDYALESDVMNAHQKASIGNALIQKVMGWYYKVPKKFEDLVYMSSVLQGMGIRHGIEAHRRHRPYCMGTLYWQMNDSWPVVSWSSIDYYGNWKALQYQARRAYANVILSGIHEGDNFNVWVCSDSLQTVKEARLTFQLMDFNGKIIKEKTVEGDVAANTSAIFATERYEDWAAQPRNTFLLLTLDDSHKRVIARYPYYFNYAKDQDLPAADVNMKISCSEGSCAVTVKSQQLVRDLFIETPWQGARYSDNFFDLLPGETRRIVITNSAIKKGEQPTIILHSVNNI
ncbi:MAG: beta-mannosidase [Prevotella sp.]|jgi:beta-mannosidase